MVENERVLACFGRGVVFVGIPEALLVEWRMSGRESFSEI